MRAASSSLIHQPNCSQTHRQDSMVFAKLQQKRVHHAEKDSRGEIESMRCCRSRYLECILIALVDVDYLVHGIQINGVTANLATALAQCRKQR